ncbi:ABC transporter permease [Rhizobium sp. BK251]|uniref:ABC transporter permease n=1 Tax=Rhizobium sp. BK251 TaxID=2512125 RepID=UPI0010435C58|nr:ABC transporter permease [Rhizobium sp. BK251]TCL71412.1 monosaccharide ABC transporter membrane protein (CUT2 family) [Rhizobium sp. BK251]
MSVETLALTAQPRRVPIRLSAAAVLVLVSAGIYAGAALATGEINQLSFEGFAGLFQRMVALGLVGLGQTFVILVGSIDLSVAALISTVAVLASYIMQADATMILPAIVACLAVCVVVGAVNGVLVAYCGINPLIATLGTGLTIQGILSAAFAYLQGSVAPAFQAFAYSGLSGIPWPLLMFVVLAAGAGFVLSGTVFGARLYAVGGNPEGARLAGIRTERFVLAAHVISSLFAGVAGLYLAARLQSGTPWIGRDGIYDLESIAVTVIGGTILAGGKGGVGGTVAGVLLFASLDASFNMLGVDAFLKQVLRGAIVIIAVAVHAVREKGHVA